MHEKRFFQLMKTGANADLYIYGDICAWAIEELGEQSGVTIVNQLKELEADQINVHINSYGGDVAEGLAIYNALKQHPAKITTICDGFACSAASVVFMAGDERIMNPASLLMIHNAWTSAVGNATDLRKAADDIETITQASVEAYKMVANISEDEIKRLMDAETWILPADAVAYGFATGIADAEETDEPQQSALSLIISKLTAKQEAEPIDLDALADKVAERLAPKEPEHKEPADENGWDTFFNKGE